MTTPSGLIEWGQAGIYNAVDDRRVIAAVTRNRTGLVWPATVTSGSGLNITVAGGWLGVADCGDRTSAVVGSPLDQTVTAVPGPATGSRQDVIWCDIQPDDAIWQLVVIPATATVGRPGIPLAFLTVPANATLASQIGIVPADATLERRLMAYANRNDSRVASGTLWSNSPTVCWTENVVMMPGQWYRVHFTAHSVQVVSGSMQLRIGIGWHLAGTSDNTSVLARASTFELPRVGSVGQADVEHLFRHPVTAAASTRNWDGRIWAVNPGTYRVAAVTGLSGANVPAGAGPGLTITVEDMGS
jgi:hypothetical protein